MSGLMTVPGLAYYRGSKYALEGILETLGKEVAGFGIRVTAVAPGSFRTNWAGRSMIRTERSIPDYDALMDPVRAHRRTADGNQLGDPEKAAAAILSVIDSADPPTRRHTCCSAPTPCDWYEPAGRPSTPRSRNGPTSPAPQTSPKEPNCRTEPPDIRAGRGFRHRSLS
ncbi:SDR family NAD(P)-dependent oxidoreductase [Nocardia brasiliensis]